MDLLLDESEEALVPASMARSDHCTLADVAFMPHLERLEHLNILGLGDQRRRVADWYHRCKRRPGFHHAMMKCERLL